MARNKPIEVIFFAVFRIISFFILILPIRLGLILGKYAGRLCFYLLKKERLKALNNLDIAFGSSKDVEEKKAIAREAFENLGKNLIEVISLPKLTRRGIDKYITCNNFNLLKRLKEENKGGVIILSAHFGNWELMAHYITIMGVPVNVIARRVRMEKFENFLSRLRKKNNINILYRDASAKEVITLLKNNKFVGIMPDQDMDSVSGVFVDFFGKSAYTPNGPAVLNSLTGALIVPLFIVRKNFGHELLVEEPLGLSATGDRQKDILENTKTFTKVIENYIRKFPSHWVWFHDRWKTRP